MERVVCGLYNIQKETTLTLIKILNYSYLGPAEYQRAIGGAFRHPKGVMVELWTEV